MSTATTRFTANGILFIGYDGKEQFMSNEELHSSVYTPSYEPEAVLTTLQRMEARPGATVDNDLSKEKDPWSKADEMDMLYMYALGFKWSDMASRLKRTQEAVRIKFVRTRKQIELAIKADRYLRQHYGKKSTP